MYFKFLVAASLAANFLPVNAENEYLAKAESMHPASAVNGNSVSRESVFADSSKDYHVRLISKYALCSAVIRGILHERNHAHIIHQQGNGIFPF